MTNKTKGFLALALTALILGIFGVLIRTLAVSFSDAGQVLARSTVATLAISAIVIYKKAQPFRISKEDLKYVALFCVVFPLSVLCLTASINLTKVSNSIFMLFVGSLCSTAFFGKIIFKEVFSIKHIISLVLVIIGLCFFVWPFSTESFNLGLVLGILGGVFEGSSHTLRKLLKNVQREVIVFYQSVSGIVFALLFVLSSSEPIVNELTLIGALTVLLFGMLLVTIGYLLAYGFKNFDVNLGTIVLTTEVFFALIINYFLLHESPTQYEFIGGMIIFVGAIATSLNLKSYKKKFSLKAKSGL